MKRSTYSVKQPVHSHRKKLVVAAVVAAIFVVMLIIWLVVFREKAVAPTAAEPQAAAPAADQPESVTGKYLFSGTIVMARAVEKYANGDYNQPFSKFSTFNPKQYDGWLADWECPSDGDTVIPYAQQVANTVFNCRPEWLPYIGKYLNALNLANNHTSDMGQDVFLKTQKYVIDAGLQAVGNYDPGVEKDRCEVMALPVHLKMPDGSDKKATLPVAYCAWHYFERPPRAGEIEYMKKYSDVMPVFGLMQVGVEYVAKAGADQEAVAHKIIDSGAEFVIGNSPHWVQNTEVYKGKLVVYSTGNFIFDQLDSETNRGVSIAVDATIPYDDNVAAWLKLGDSCQKHYDNCLEQARAQGLKKIDMKLSFEPVANTSGVRTVTQKAPASIQAAVEQRMNWAKTLQELGQ